MTAARWLVAKYIPDLRRREPRNIGVIAGIGTNVQSRFLGQRPDGTVDGRRTKWAGSVAVYKAWIEYWREHARDLSRVDDLLSHAVDDNYVLEFGGERIAGGADEIDVRTLAETLYINLVEDLPQRDSLTIAELSETVIKRLGIEHRVKRSERIDLNADSISFDYRYDNGRVNLMQRINLVYDDDRSWDNVHAAAWAFQKVKDNPKFANAQTIALIKQRNPDRELVRQLGVLTEHAEPVDVTEENRATLVLADLLHISTANIALN